MNTRRTSLLLGVGALAVLLALGPPAQTQQPAQEADNQDGVEVQARGPVHEAYAEPSEQRPEPSPVVTRQPPDAVDEQPPEQKPDGDNVQWLPGYWAWDEDSSDFLWVSGFWRDVPPDRQWVPGNWQEVEGGWQWTPGFWGQTDQQEINYVPPPPPSIDRGPSVPAPDASSVYVPGCWIHQRVRYLWRPGFWVASRPDWMWVPAHYVWTPCGCIFVEGYWDHPLHERGLLFAPVRIDRRFLARQRWSYVPRYVVQQDFLMSAMFVRPASCHYYFGDFFEARYRQRGYIAWVDYRINRSSYDPNYAYYRHAYRRHPRWERELRALYVARREGTVPRPPRTLIQQTQVVKNITVRRTTNVTVNKNINITNVQNVTVLAPLTQVNNTRVTALASLAGVNHTRVKNLPVPTRALKLATVSRQQRAAVHQEAQQLHRTATERRQVQARLLTQGGTPVKPTDRPKVAKINLPRPSRALPRTTERRKTPPPPPAAPKHETRPIPKHESPRPVRPPQHPEKKPVVQPRRDLSPRDKKPPQPPRKEVPPPRDRKVSPPPRKDAPPPRKEVPPPKDSPRDKKPPRKEVPPPRKEVPPPRDRKVSPPPRKDAPPRKEVPPPRKDSPRDKKPPQPSRKEVLPPRKEVPPPRKEVKPPEPPKKVPPPRKEVPPPRKENKPPPPPKKVPPPPPPPRKDAPPRDKKGVQPPQR